MASTAARRSPLATRTDYLQMSGTRKMANLAMTIPDVIHLEVGDPDFATPLYICQAVKEDLDSGKYTHYTPPAGFPELRHALAAKIKQDSGITVDPENELMVTPGSAAALYVAIMATIDPGDEVLVPDPGYPQYREMTKMAGGIPIGYPLREENDFQPVIDEVRRLVSPRTKAMIINSPHNPTGTVFSHESLTSLASLAQEYDLLVITDEIYSFLVFDDTVHYSMATLPGMFERTITLNGFSKTYAMTGWRLGYAFAPAEIIREMVKLESLVYTCPSAISQRAGLAALARTDASQEMRAEYQRRRDWLVTALNELPDIHCLPPNGTFFVFPNISAYSLSSEDFALRLIQTARIATVPGTAFGSMGEGHIRLAYTASLEVLQTALERIRAALPEMRKR